MIEYSRKEEVTSVSGINSVKYLHTIKHRNISFAVTASIFMSILV